MHRHKALNKAVFLSSLKVDTLEIHGFHSRVTVFETELFIVSDVHQWMCSLQAATVEQTVASFTFGNRRKSFHRFNRSFKEDFWICLTTHHDIYLFFFLQPRSSIYKSIHFVIFPVNDV